VLSNKDGKQRNKFFREPKSKLTNRTAGTKNIFKLKLILGYYSDENILSATVIKLLVYSSTRVSP